MVPVLLVAMAVSAGPSVRCLTPNLLPLPRVDLSSKMPSVRAATKTQRDAFGTFPHLLSTTNFALKWGSQGGVLQGEAQTLINAFEVAWAAEVVRMGHPQPEASSAYLFNVYIGDTGDGAPDSFGAGGYFYLDPDGFPMIVINPLELSDADEAASVAAHEFYHSLQYTTGSYDYDGVAAWYWETTAEWVVPEVLPGNPYYGSFLGGYALLPELPVDFFDYPDTGALTELHQYGAFIFPRYLTEQVADWTLIRQSWVAAGGEQDPLVVIADLLRARSVDLGEAFGEFAARNATWDYQDGAYYQSLADLYGQYYPQSDHRLVDTLFGAGTSTWRDAPAATRPGRFAYNIIRLAMPLAGTLHVEFAGDSAGSLASPASYRVTVVRDLGTGIEYVPVTLTGVTGSAQVAGIKSTETLYLVVAAYSAQRPTGSGETFDYRYQMSMVAGSSPGGNPSRRPAYGKSDSGCGCNSLGDSIGWAGLATLALIRRRRWGRG